MNVVREYITKTARGKNVNRVKQLLPTLRSTADCWTEEGLSAAEITVRNNLSPMLLVHLPVLYYCDAAYRRLHAPPQALLNPSSGTAEYGSAKRIVHGFPQSKVDLEKGLAVIESKSYRTGQGATACGWDSEDMMTVR